MSPKRGTNFHRINAWRLTSVYSAVISKIRSAQVGGTTVGGKSGAAELRDCADVDGDSAVTSNEAASMLTSCMSYKGGPPLSETGRATLRGLALGC